MSDSVKNPDQRACILRRFVWLAVFAIPVFYLLIVIAPPLSLRNPGPPVAKIPPSSPALVEQASFKPRKILPLNEAHTVQAIQPIPRTRQTPKSKPAVNLPRLRLKGITRQGDRSWAFINDQMLSVGDSIDGVTVTEISEDGVVVEYWGRKYSLKR